MKNISKIFRATQLSQLISRTISIAIVLLSLQGCLYLADTQQGNVIEPEKLAQVKVGQTREQVQYLLGTPVVDNVLNTDRADYAFYFKDGENGDITIERVTVLFENDRVTDIVYGGDAPGSSTASKQFYRDGSQQP